MTKSCENAAGHDANEPVTKESVAILPRLSDVTGVEVDVKFPPVLLNAWALCMVKPSVCPLLRTTAFIVALAVPVM